MVKANLIILGIVAIALIVVTAILNTKIDNNNALIEHLVKEDSLKSIEDKKEIDSLNVMKSTLLKQDSLNTIKLKELEKKYEDLSKKYNSISVKLPRY